MKILLLFLPLAFASGCASTDKTEDKSFAAISHPILARKPATIPRSSLCGGEKIDQIVATDSSNEMDLIFSSAAIKIDVVKEPAAAEVARMAFATGKPLVISYSFDDKKQKQVRDFRVCD